MTVVCLFVLFALISQATKPDPNEQKLTKPIESEKEDVERAPAAVDSKPREQPETNVAKPIHPAFSDPKHVAAALASQGYRESKWERTDPTGTVGGYSFHHEHKITPGAYQYVGDLPNTITFWGKGDHPDVIELIELIAFIPNTAKEASVLKQYVELVPELFESLELSIPEGLVDAVQHQRTLVVVMDYGDITFLTSPGNMGYSLCLTIKIARDGVPRESLKELEAIAKNWSLPPGVRGKEPKTESEGTTVVDALTDESPASAPVPRPQPSSRTWTDSTGTYSVKASFAGLAFGKVKLRKEDGTVIELPVEKLSKADQQWIHDRR